MKILDKIIKVDIEDLIPYHNNPKNHPQEQISKIASSIKNYGFTQPIVVDEKNEIIIGHGRYLASKQLNLDKVPVIKREDLTDRQIRAFRIADNKVAESEWDMDLLELELEDLADMETGFDIDEFNDIVGEEIADQENNEYTNKISSPQYFPIGIQPDISDLYKDDKYQELLTKIENAEEITEEQREFLKLTAQRHIIFNYENIAEYYAHAESEMQELMEALALVIIDFDDAIEQGFVEISEEVLSRYDG